MSPDDQRLELFDLDEFIDVDPELAAKVELSLAEEQPASQDLAAATAQAYLEGPLRQMRERLGGGKPWRLPEPCWNCGAMEGRLTKTNGQNVLRCASCDEYQKNLSKTETGEAPRTVRSLRPDVKPRQRVRIFERDGYRCLCCGAGPEDGILTIGHIVSVADAVAIDGSGPYLQSDENLVTECETCNLGRGDKSMLPRNYLIIVLRLLQAADRDYEPFKSSARRLETAQAAERWQESEDAQRPF